MPDHFWFDRWRKNPASADSLIPADHAFTVTDRANPRGFQLRSPRRRRLAATVLCYIPVPEHEAHPSGVRTIAPFCVTECLPDDVITDKTELLTPVYLMTTLMPDVPATTGNLKGHLTGFDTELSLMFSIEDISFQALREVCRAFWRMASSSSRSAS